MGMEEYIPAGFVPLANWDHKRRGNNDGHSVQWKALGDAVKVGDIPGFRLPNGRWYVHHHHAAEFLAKASDQLPLVASKATRKTPTPDSQTEAVIVALCEINNGVAVMCDVLDRLTKAVESIATQPRTEEQVREAITTACRNADGFDGFHS